MLCNIINVKVTKMGIENELMVAENALPLVEVGEGVEVGAASTNPVGEVGGGADGVVAGGIRIDAGIPIPRRSGLRLGTLPVPIFRMKLGESFFYAPPTEDGTVRRLDRVEDARFRALVWSRAKVAGVKVTVTRTVEDGVDGYRVWRIA